MSNVLRYDDAFGYGVWVLKGHKKLSVLFKDFWLWRCEAYIKTGTFPTRSDWPGLGEFGVNIRYAYNGSPIAFTDFLCDTQHRLTGTMRCPVIWRPDGKDPFKCNCVADKETYFNFFNGNNPRMKPIHAAYCIANLPFSPEGDCDIEVWVEATEDEI